MPEFDGVSRLIEKCQKLMVQGRNAAGPQIRKITENWIPANFVWPAVDPYFENIERGQPADARQRPQKEGL
jgi:hypothetical protein